MAKSTIIQRFIDEAKDALDAARELGLTPRQAVEALDDVIEYAENLRAEYADDAARAGRARSLVRGGRVRAAKSPPFGDLARRVSHPQRGPNGLL